MLKILKIEISRFDKLALISKNYKKCIILIFFVLSFFKLF